MGVYTQAKRPLAVTTPLGKDALLLVELRGREAISELFNFQFDLLAKNEAGVAFDRLLGQKVCGELLLPDGKSRYFHGIVNRLSQGRRDLTFTHYRADIVPQFWVLTKKVQSRIFQHQTVPEILKKVLAGLDVAWEIRGTFQPRDYCAQYRESDFDFASRLMEEEGIYYFFKHSAGGHTMVVANLPGSHVDVPGEPSAIYEEIRGGNRVEDRISAWEKVQELRSGKLTLWDHCFELPHKHLDASKSIQDSVAVGSVTHKLKVANNDKLEIYDFPGGYAQRFDGVDKSGGDKSGDLQNIFEDNKRTVEIRMQQEALPSLLIEGSSNCRQFVSGHKFRLERHFDADGPYVLTAVEHSASVEADYRSGEGEQLVYQNRFQCIPFALPFRPRQGTPRPTVLGSQSAVVVGPAGSEIFTDKYGRVKVQFHWDREGKNDADSSCWIRVAQAYAGKGWGSICIPRIGQEVIVDFMEGDPDQPIVTGRVYNADAMPPYPLPGGNAISGLKSNSTPGGGGYNEFILDDTKGKELIRVHGQFDMDSTIEHDLREHVKNNRSRDVKVNETIQIGVDQSITVGSNQSLKVGSNQTFEIGANQTGKVGANKSLDVGANHTEKIGSNMTINVGSCLTESVGINYAETVGAAMELTVGAAMTLSVGAAMMQSVGAAYMLSVGAIMKESVGASKSSSVGSNLTETVGGKHSETVTGAYTLKAKTIALEAEESVVIKTGDASITLKSGGEVTIKGSDLTFKGSGKIGAKADGDIVMKGSNILQN